MGRWLLCACVVLLAPSTARAAKADPLGDARALYNQRKFEAAVNAAERARLDPALADGADLVAARAYLERFRESAASDDLVNARDRLRRLNPERFAPSERVELVVGLGEALYFDESYGAAADIFASVLDAEIRTNTDTTYGTGGLPTEARERVLDWWASALDRGGRARVEGDRSGVYERIRARMEGELVAHPASATASYWLAAASVGRGDGQAAWDAAEAGWVRAPLASDRGAALRADLDRLVLHAIVPERAKALAQPPDALRLEWERFKERWKKD
ncbi:MAG: hypothetical protein ACHQQR_04940 [Gemmatimonadales bacterium]